MRADANNATCLQNILEKYVSCSGQMINREKSSVLFSKNTSLIRKQEEVKNILQLSSEATNEKYLGLPIYISHSKSKAFKSIKDRIWKRNKGGKKSSCQSPGRRC